MRKPSDMFREVVAAEAADEIERLRSQADNNEPLRRILALDGSHDLIDAQKIAVAYLHSQAENTGTAASNGREGTAGGAPCGPSQWVEGPHTPPMNAETRWDVLTRNLLEAIADPDNDPDEPIADNGAILIELWRHEAKRILAYPREASPPMNVKGPAYFCEWLRGYFEGGAELDAYEANQIRKALTEMVYPPLPREESRPQQFRYYTGFCWSDWINADGVEWRSVPSTARDASGDAT